ncbi:MAG: hypothetical protein ACLSGS_05715 [Adlercreutzia sp.]
MADTTQGLHPPEFEGHRPAVLEPLRRCDIDTLVLGCTHYPLLKALIGAWWRKVTLNLADETPATSIISCAGAAPTPARATCPSISFSLRPTT